MGQRTQPDGLSEEQLRYMAAHRTGTVNEFEAELVELCLELLDEVAELRSQKPESTMDNLKSRLGLTRKRT